MLSPIPVRLLRHKATVHVPNGIDESHNPAGETVYNVERCCIQRASKTIWGKDNTSVQLQAIMFIDARLTMPHIDWAEEKRKADESGGRITVDHDGQTYTVEIANELLDDMSRVHHYELGLI